MSDPLPSARVPARAWLWAFGAALAVELLAVAFGWDGVRWVSKGALTLLLLGYLRSALAPGQTVARLFAAGLLFACAADLALLVDGTPAFLTGMGLFAVMQVLYIAAFVKLGAIHAFDSGRVVLISYFAFWAGLITALWTQLGPLAAPVAVYSLLLVAMAALAGVLGFWNTLKHPLGWGGLLFVVSDSILGLGVAGYDIPGAGLAVMSTYGIAQLLLTLGTARFLKRRPAH